MGLPRQPTDRAAYESIVERASAVLGAELVAREMAAATAMQWADVQAEAFSL